MYLKFEILTQRDRPYHIRFLFALTVILQNALARVKRPGAIGGKSKTKALHAFAALYHEAAAELRPPRRGRSRLTSRRLFLRDRNRMPVVATPRCKVAK
jgi:hypothetical protein